MTRQDRSTLVFGNGARRRAPLAVCLITASAILLATPLRPEAAMQYTVRLTEPQTQTASIEIVIPDVSSAALTLYLPTWRPGLYSILDPAATLRHVRAHDRSRRELEIRKVDKSSWRVRTDNANEVVVTYDVYANSLGNRTRHVDATHAFLSGSAVFLYLPERRSQPLRVRLEAPDDWLIASGLDTDPTDPRVLLANSYDVLVDSPIEIGLQEHHAFEVRGKPHELAIWPPGTRYDTQRLLEDITSIVSYQAELFGDLPYERYVFIVHAGAGAHGGTEHLNSTVIQTTRAALEGSFKRSKDYRSFLGVVSHEAFHTWNVKQLRPAGLQPYDYQRENYSTLLWVAEGTTSYYDDLTLVRTGLLTPKQYLEQIGKTIDEWQRRPGGAVQSLSESSYDAWIQYRQKTPDDVNATVSFYSKGALVSLLLDLEIRHRTAGRRRLDDVMKVLYRRFPLGAGGYQQQDLKSVVETIAGGSFEPFFQAYVDGTAPLPLADALPQVGLELFVKAKTTDDDSTDGDEPALATASTTTEEGAIVGGDSPEANNNGTNGSTPSERAYIGLELAERDGQVVVNAVLADGPAYEAGVIAGDVLVALDRRRLAADELEDRLELYHPNDSVTLHLMRYDELLSVDLVLGAEPNGSWSLRRVAEPTAEQKEAYASWIGQPWPDEAAGSEKAAP